jgi:hypothetical protein
MTAEARAEERDLFPPVREVRIRDGPDYAEPDLRFAIPRATMRDRDRAWFQPSSASSPSCGVQ